MENVWILVECISDCAYAFKARENAEETMIDMIAYLCTREGIIPPSRDNIRAYCEKNNWNCFDMYIMKAEQQN